EDGIRDPLVTGVQTCALPILFERLRAAASDSSVSRKGPSPIITSGMAPFSFCQASRRTSAPFSAESLPTKSAKPLEEERLPGSEIGRASCREVGRAWVGATAE